MDTMTPMERTRRFWTAHGRSADHLTILHAFCSNPTIAWAPEGLSIWYGLRIDRAHSIVAEFAQCGIVQAVPDRAGYFRWDQAQDFALPHGREGRGIVCDRWTDQVVGTPGGVRADRRPP